MNATVIVSSIGVIFTASSATMIFPFLPLYLLELGCTEDNVSLWASVVTAGTFLTASIVMPWWGALADRLGRKKMMLRSSGCVAAAYLLGSVVISPLQLLGVRIFQGFSFGFLSSGQALVSASAGKKAGRALGFFLAGRSAGTVMGPFIGGLLAHYAGIRTSFLLAGCGAAFAFLLILFFVKEPPMKKTRTKQGLFASFRILRHNDEYLHLLGLTVINQTALLIINPVIAIHIGHLAGSMDNASMLSGLILGAGGAAGMITSPLWGYFGEKKGFYRAMCLCFLGDGIFTVSQFFADTVLVFGILQFFYGLFLIGGMVTITGAISSCTDPSMRGSAFGITSTAMNAGNFLGPVIGGFVSTVFGISAIFLAAGIVQLAAGLFIWKQYGAEIRSGQPR